MPRDYLQGEAWLTKAADLGHEEAKETLANLKLEIAKARKQGFIPAPTLKAAAPQPNAEQHLAPGGSFRIPPACTVATYQCTGGAANTVKYSVESVEGDMLTVKVTGDGKDFGTYRRKAWQMVGTTLYEELIYKGKTYQGGDAVETQTVVAALAGGEGFKTQAQLERFMSIGEPPISSDEFVKRIPGPVTDFFMEPILHLRFTREPSRQPKRLVVRWFFSSTNFAKRTYQNITI